MMNWQQWVVAILLLLCIVRIGWGIYAFFRRTKENGNPCANCVTGCDLKRLMDGLRLQLLPDRENIIILPTTKEAEVSKILPVLSALTDGYRITVVGFPEWQAFTSVDHETYFKLNTKIFTYSYVDNTTEPAKRFALKYRKYFYTEPNNLAYKAFDMSLYFIELAAKYRDRTLDALEFYPRNGDFSRFYFQKMEGQAGKENQGFYIVNFGSDYRLKIESL